MSQIVSQYIKSKKNKKDDKKNKKKDEDEEPKLSKIPAQILRRKNGFYYENELETLEKKLAKQKISKRVERKI